MYGQNGLNVPIEPLYGTWVNPDYNKVPEFPAKITLRPDGSFTKYGNTDITEGMEGTFTIIDSWMDSDGNKYYKVEWLGGFIGKTEYHHLWRLNETDTVWESNWSTAEYPTEIDPEQSRYRVHYRQ